ncbi:MAG: phosphoribosylamine--glycine ligase [Candidatus Komeilibacteria bacterium]|nr:phosphoribosylamine--glycine ligase [Candidatus Komeilibacteria bacterium]
MIKVLLIGSGAREHAIAHALKLAKEDVELFVYGSSLNPGIKELAADYKVGPLKSNTAMASYASLAHVDLAIVGPENPLAEGISDVLGQVGIPCVGPTKQLAQIETSKSFARDLLTEYKINGCPKYKFFVNEMGLKEYLMELGDNFVIKADGLMGGKGVLVSGDHFNGQAEGLKLAIEFIKNGSQVLIEEKLIGQEFSLMSFCDGDHLIHMPAVQDHKRALTGDKGANTGGMGSYSCADFSLPFLDEDDIAAAQKTNEATALSLKKKFGVGYKGILYGGFMATQTGVKLIEYNARFGDPEAMNVLSLFSERTFPANPAPDFLQVCQAIVNGTLNKVKMDLKKQATVVKYIVPEGYPESPVINQIIDVSKVDQAKVRLFYGSVDQKADGLYLGGSRALAVVATADDVDQAEKIVETEIKKITGPVFHREDIGTSELIEKRVKMMKELRS